MMSTSGITSATSTTHESSSKSRTNAQPAKTAAQSFAKLPARPKPVCAQTKATTASTTAAGKIQRSRQSGSAISTSSNVPGSTTIEMNRTAGRGAMTPCAAQRGTTRRRRAARQQGAPALASVARRVGHLRGASPGPDLPAAAGIRPARRDRRPGSVRPSCPAGDWDVAVFDNRFPALGGHGRADVPELHVPTAPAGGHCEVVVFTPDRDSSLGALAAGPPRAAARGLGRPDAPARRPRRRALGVPVREPRRRGRRHAAPPARPDLRLPVGAAGAGAHGGAGARAPRRHGRGPLDAMIEAERRDGVRIALRRRARRRLRAGLRALSLRVLGRADPAGGAVRRPRRRRSAPTSRAR